MAGGGWQGRKAERGAVWSGVARAASKDWEVESCEAWLRGEGRGYCPGTRRGGVAMMAKFASCGPRTK